MKNDEPINSIERWSIQFHRPNLMNNCEILVFSFVYFAPNAIFPSLDLNETSWNKWLEIRSIRCSWCVFYYPSEENRREEGRCARVYFKSKLVVRSWEKKNCNYTRKRRKKKEISRENPQKNKNVLRKRRKRNFCFQNKYHRRRSNMFHHLHRLNSNHYHCWDCPNDQDRRFPVQVAQSLPRKQGEDESEMSVWDIREKLVILAKQ